MKMDVKALIKWLEKKIKEQDVPTGHGVAYDESVAPLFRDAYNEVLTYVRRSSSLCLSDLLPGDYFRFADGKEEEVIFQRGNGDQVLEMNRHVGEYFEVENDDLLRPVVKLQPEWKEVGK